MSKGNFMSFNDIFARTTINEQVSLSIDEFDKIIASMLVVPDKNKVEHDHIEFKDKDELNIFLNILCRKGGIIKI